MYYLETDGNGVLVYASEQTVRTKQGVHNDHNGPPYAQDHAKLRDHPSRVTMINGIDSNVCTDTSAYTYVKETDLYMTTSSSTIAWYFKNVRFEMDIKYFNAVKKLVEQSKSIGLCLST